MDQSSEIYDRPVQTPPVTRDRVIGDADYVEDVPVRYAAAPRIGVGENAIPVRDRVQWGPILAGTLASLGTLFLLSLLGLAVGASAFEPGTDVTDWGAWAGI